MSLPPGYTLTPTTPTPETYNSLRLASGLTPFSPEAATLALPNSLFSLLLNYQDPITLSSSSSSSPSSSTSPEPIGMARVTGDAGCFYQVTDICILPVHRGKGLGKAIMAAVEAWLLENVPKTAHIGGAGECGHESNFLSHLEMVHS
ncbi:hypothetical protein G7Y79_00016g040880 [Physcia stellaris]|nr:hypothetical protein G7Y79_00016g040880 [Physcia stellaris]